MKYKACERCFRSVGMVNIIGNVMMIVLKAYLGVVGGSKGLIADAIHSVADLLATFVMIIGMRLSAQKPDEDYPDGYGKTEYMIAICIYLFLFVIGLYIMHDGYVTIIEKKIVHPCWFALWGAFFAIAINELMFRQSVCAGTQAGSPSMIAKAWESRSDVYASIAVLIGILGAMMGFSWMDPLAALIVGVVIIKLCIESIYESVLKLMDQAAEGDEPDEARAAIEKELPEAALHKLVARELGPVLDMRIWLAIDPAMTMEEAEALKAKAERVIRAAVKRNKMKLSVNLVPAGSEG
ncbi:magnetosome protein MamB [Fundidesulfovibrio magnetotacticus]|uniref:Magnetosome protein MamB n=1 Tax=Fundidesulfovibrio magnetotacticus TaxID=2730080 RepID=A0A6V8LQ89_9BACT|nr:cation diffusion facilitator family transporter [Fundidesulfovibrio magnetotacticus]GFK92289.1 magnetosome protein MamB [Fundidesulfovibrio magnetotacticus]